MDVPKIRVLIVDDSSFMRNILSRIIERDSRFEVVGKAKDGREGVELAAQLRPDVITMDIEMPEMNGLQALQYIMSSNPTPVVMISSLTESGTEATIRALEIGAVDFIPKSLNDNDKSIFRNAEKVHERLAQAAAAKVMPRSSRASTAVPTPTPTQKEGSLTPQSAALAAAAKTPAANRPSRLEKVRLLLIGSSTGGPRALQEVVAQLPQNLRVPVIIVQHMPANFTGPMANRLNDLSHMTIQEAADGMILQRGNVYVCPGGVQTRIKKVEGGIALQVLKDDPKSTALFKPSVDIMGNSVLEIFKGEVLAVMLTGMGSDGAQAYKALHDDGAYVIAQDQATSVVYGMPKAVVDKGAASEVLPLADIAGVVTKLLQ